MDAALQRWKVEHATTADTDPRPNLVQYDAIRDAWLLGIFSSNRLYTDWTVAQPNENARKGANWEVFKDTMHNFYKPTENPTLMNFHFRALTQNSDETFPALLHSCPEGSQTL